MRPTPRFQRPLLAIFARRSSLRRGVVLLAAVLVTLLAPAPARAAVPMCSSDGRTVAAPPIILPWRQLTLEAAKPCQQPENPLLRAMPDQQQKSPSNAPAPAPLRAVPVRALELPEPSGVRQPVDGAADPTHFVLVASIYRPPRP